YGCNPIPPLPGLGMYNMTEEKSCWNRPREGAVAHYSCNSSKILKGPDSLVCKNGSWTPESPYWPRNAKPFCSKYKF
ncbi:sushi domain-containing protein, partial [Nephila pilipes]